MGTGGSVAGWVRLACLALALGGSGCAIDVDLTSTPTEVTNGATVDFDISVRNRTTCPVGGVVAVMVPFVPKDLLIDEIEDPQLREALSEFVDAFCTGADVTPPDGSADCRLEDGELICDIDPGQVFTGQSSYSAVVKTSGGEDVTCGGDGEKLTCRFPRHLVQTAMAQQTTANLSPGALQCDTLGDVVVCGALVLDPNETKSDDISLVAAGNGVMRNWVVSFATVRGGVCSAGILPRVPCDEPGSTDSDCPALNKACGSGICVGGSDAGFGCNSGADCDSNVCDPCEIDGDGQVLSGVACSTTLVDPVKVAPAASTWGLLAMIASLGALALGGLRLRRMS